MNTGQTDGRVAGDASGARGSALGNRVTYSFIAYREFPGEVVWIDELYTAECVRQQGVARWLVWQVGYRRHVELQVSVASTAQAEAARQSYTAMGMRALRNRERSRVVTAPDAGHRIWWTPEYSITSGWTPIPHRDTQVHGQWSTLTEGQQQTLVHTTMQVHGY